MFGVFSRVAARHAFAIGAAIAAIGSSMALATGASAADITITVTKFHALDKADELSRGDFFARMTIDGQSVVTPTISDQAEVKPKDWTLTKSVTSGGKVKVKLELIDKDLSVDDPIDINRMKNKRDLDFVVDVDSCHVEGFSEGYSCGKTITRAGSENKKASISFKVDVKK